MPESESTATSVVPPPMSTTIEPVGSWIGRPAPMAAAIGSYISPTRRAEALRQESLIARRSTAVAPDGRRLAKQEGPATSVGEQPASDRATIIPSRAMQLLDRALSDSEETLQLAARENDVIVRSGPLCMYSRLVEGRFPKWRDVFPRRENALQVQLTVGPFGAATRQAAIVTSEERRGVDFTFGDGKVVLTAHGAEYGESHVELPIAYDGAPVGITLDPRYLNDFLRVLGAEQTVTLELRDAESAAVCTTEDGYAYVIMPLARDQRG